MQFHDDIFMICIQQDCRAKNSSQHCSEQKSCNPHQAIVLCDHPGGEPSQSQQNSTRRRKQARSVYRKQVKPHPSLTRVQYLPSQWRKAAHPPSLLNMAQHPRTTSRHPIHLQPHHNPPSQVDEHSSWQLKRNSRDTTALKHRWTSRFNPWVSQWGTVEHQLMMCDLSSW
jgi:hypothetical protein